MSKNIVIITNILTPYRAHFFKVLETSLKQDKGSLLVILTASNEDNREWHYDDFDLDFSILLDGVSIKILNVYIHFVFGLNSILRQTKPDFIILGGHYMQPNNILLILKKRYIKSRIFFWSESNNIGVRKNRILLKPLISILRKITYKNVDGFLSPGKYADEFISSLSNGQPIIRIPNLIDNEQFLSLSRKPFDQNEFKLKYLVDGYKFILFTTARLEPIKGILEMIKKLSNSIYREEIVYVIAGSGSIESKIYELALDCNVNVRLVGYLNQSDVIKFHIVSYCYVMPSLIDPYPLSVIEALWLSKPLLISKFVGNTPETLFENHNGFLMNMYDDNAIEVDKLLSLSKEEYHRFCLSSFKYAKMNFDSIKKTKEFMNDLKFY
jgi:glycosyltransferase involved in cell wall biosynthesis